MPVSKTPVPGYGLTHWSPEQTMSPQHSPLVSHGSNSGRQHLPPRQIRLTGPKQQSQSSSQACSSALQHRSPPPQAGEAEAQKPWQQPFSPTSALQTSRVAGQFACRQMQWSGSLSTTHPHVPEAH
jgi:hypothetical protein